eukprot:TRINITY_DN969_c0_g1_i1.p1 TRINITY_DN969_c0_g1~~TRINITY_DN969_c0_g1_i1.p1  ORF type:complete len:197 (-),score=29.36 TRINITY_DN969_c0_g1_i1:148-738(-)
MITEALFDIELDPSVYSSPETERDDDSLHSQRCLRSSSPIPKTPPSFESPVDIPPSPLKNMDPPPPAPIPQANSEGYNKVKLRYMQRLNFDKQQLAQRTLTAEKNRERTGSYPVAIPSSSPQAIANIPVDIPKDNGRKTRSTIQLTTLGHKRFEEEDDFDLKENAATFVPPHLIQNEASFSVQRFHDRKRLARMAF